MQRTKLRRAICALLFTFLSACGGGSTTSPFDDAADSDATSSRDGAHGDDVALPTDVRVATDAEFREDVRWISRDANGSCDLPDAAIEAVFGPAGGTLELCGATVVIGERTLQGNSRVRLARVAGDPAPVGPFVVDGFVYQLELEHGAQARVTLSLPHARHESDVDLFEYADGQWLRVGLCSVRDGSAEQTLQGGGTFALLRDVRALPTSPEGLGTVSGTAQFGGAPMTFQHTQTSYAAVSAIPDGRLNVEFRAVNADGGTVDVDLAYAPGGPAIPLTIRHTDVRGERFEWSASDAGVVPMQLTANPRIGYMSVAFRGALRSRAGHTVAIDGHFNLTVAAWKRPTLRTCVR